MELVGGLYVCFNRAHVLRRIRCSARSATPRKSRWRISPGQLERWQFGMIDCQMNTAHLASLGAREIPRAEFIARLRELVHLCADYPLAIRYRPAHMSQLNDIPLSALHFY